MAGGSVWIGDEAGGAGFFAGGEVVAVSGVGVVDAGEFGRNGDGDDFASVDFLLVEEVVGEDGGRECAGEGEERGGGR